MRQATVSQANAKTTFGKHEAKGPRQSCQGLGKQVRGFRTRSGVKKTSCSFETRKECF